MRQPAVQEPDDNARGRVQQEHCAHGQEFRHAGMRHQPRGQASCERTERCRHGTDQAVAGKQCRSRVAGRHFGKA
jgi:hypothetical protein